MAKPSSRASAPRARSATRVPAGDQAWVSVVCPHRMSGEAASANSPHHLSDQEAREAEAFRRWGQLLAQDYDRTHGASVRT